MTSNTLPPEVEKMFDRTFNGYFITDTADELKQFLAQAIQDAVLAERARINKELEDIFECPYVVDVKTCPNGDSSRAEEVPWQVVGTFHMVYAKYKKLQSLSQSEGETNA